MTEADGSLSGDSVRVPRALPDGVSQATIGVRGGLLRSGFDETAEALFLTSGYVYASAADAEKAFTGEIDRFVYSALRQPHGHDVRGAVAPDRGRARRRSRPRPAWRRCSPRWARCSAAATGWWRRAACSARASWCATRSCRAGVSRPSSSTATTSPSGRRRCPSRPRRSSSRPRPTRCSRWSTSPRSSSSRTPPARKWCWTTSSPLRCCSRACRSVLTWWCTRAPSTSTARAGCWAARSWATRSTSTGRCRS